MKNLQLENVIVGSGLSAMALALSLLEQNKKFTLIFDHPGMSSLYSGALDLASQKTEELFKIHSESLEVSLNQLLAKAHHPYAVIAQGLKENFTSWLSHHLNPILNSFPYLGEALSGPLKPALALTFYGALKETFLLSPSQNLNFLELQDARVGIVGFSELNEFRSDWVFKNLTQRYADFLKAQKIDIDHQEFSLGQPEFLTQAALARFFDESSLETLTHSLKKWVEEKNLSHLIFPPVLGIAKNSEIMLKLKETLRVNVAECLAFNPSVPGYRLHQAFLTRLARRGIETKIAQITDLQITDQKVVSFSCLENSELKNYSVERLFLCSGKYFSGGISSASVQASVITEAPLYKQDQLLYLDRPESYTRHHGFLSHPLFSLGLKVNSLMQVLKEDGAVLAHNLFAAGSILSGYDAIKEGCSGGVALLTGIRAAQCGL